MGAERMHGRLERHPSGGIVARITLSRRNLMTLLTRLDAAPPGADVSIWRIAGEGLVIVVAAEEDATHYATGQTHPGAEAPLSPN